MTILKIDPVAKPRMTRRDIWKKRPVVARYYEFKDELKRLCKKEDFELPDSYMVEFLIKMPDSWSEKRKKAMVGKPHQQKPDIDNLLKALNDCLKVDDKFVWHIEASKIWWDEGQIIIYGKDASIKYQIMRAGAKPNKSS